MNFKDLDELIHSGIEEIVLDSDIILSDDEESEYLDGIELDTDDLVIDGRGHTINACGKTRIFHCTGEYITIKNVIFKNGFAAEGGAIFNEGVLTITDSTLNNNASDFGGAIFNEGVLTITDSTINENTADDGGAIHNRAELIIKESILTGNITKGKYCHGGGIYNSYKSIIIESILNNNIAEFGGAIDNRGELNITKSTLIGNTAQEGGGAIDNGGELNIAKSTLIGNNAQESGGAIFNKGMLTIDDSALNNNTAEFGGAIDNNGVLSIKKSTLSQNIVQEAGGAIYNSSDNFSIADSTFHNNVSKDNGEDIVSMKNYILENCEFRRNTSNNLNSHKCHDVYIVYAEENLDEAYKIANFFEENKIKCWLKNRDLTNDENMEELSEAIENAKLRLLIFSNDFVNSNINFQEVCMLPCIIFQIDECKIPSLFESAYVQEHIDPKEYVRKTHWTSGYLENGMDSLLRQAELILGKPPSNASYNEENKDDFSKKPIKNTSFRFLDDLIHSGEKEIVLTSDIIFDENDVPGPIKLDIDDLVIDGSGHSINALGKTEIFFITSKTTLKNIKLENGYANKNSGGAIHNYNSKIKLIDVDMINNISKFNGGAVYNNGGNINLITSNLTNNVAKTGDGGAIYNAGGETQIEDSVLTNNISENGDADVIKNYNGIVKIFDSTVCKNNTFKNLLSNEDALEIQNTKFKDNSCKNIILSIAKSTLSISNSEFTDNKTRQSPISNYGKFCRISKTNFKNNISERESSSCIYNESNLILLDLKIDILDKSILNKGELLIKKSSQDFIEKIENQGVIKKESIPDYSNFDFTYLDNLIHSSKDKKIILNHDIALKDYELDYYEGGIVLDIDNLVIDGNGKRINANEMSRIFIVMGKNIILKNIIFENGHVDKNYDNQFNNFGGALRNNSKSNLLLINCIFNNNKSENQGGAIYNRGKLKIQDSTIQNNVAVMGGGGIYNLAGEIDIVNANLKSNIVDNENINYGGESNYYCYGGAINNEKGSKLTIHSSEVINNEVNGLRCYGGAIFNNGEIKIEKTLFCENISKRNGGALYNNSGMLKINNSKISNNIADDGDGGGLYNYNGEIHLSNSVLTNNRTNYDGGGICNKFKIIITNCKLHNNVVENRNGGAISNFGELMISESELNGNTANRNGGAIWYNGKDEVMIKNCTFLGNSPDDVYEEKD